MGGRTPRRRICSCCRTPTRLAEEPLHGACRTAGRVRPWRAVHDQRRAVRRPVRRARRAGADDGIAAGSRTRRRGRRCVVRAPATSGSRITQSHRESRSTRTIRSVFELLSSAVEHRLALVDDDFEGDAIEAYFHRERWEPEVARIKATYDDPRQVRRRLGVCTWTRDHERHQRRDEASVPGRTASRTRPHDQASRSLAPPLENQVGWDGTGRSTPRRRSGCGGSTERGPSGRDPTQCARALDSRSRKVVASGASQPAMGVVPSAEMDVWW